MLERREIIDLSPCMFEEANLEDLIRVIRTCLIGIRKAILDTTPEKAPRLGKQYYNAAIELNSRWRSWFSESPQHDYVVDRMSLLARTQAELEKMVMDLLNDVMHRTIFAFGERVAWEEYKVTRFGKPQSARFPSWARPSLYYSSDPSLQ